MPNAADGSVLSELVETARRLLLLSKIVSSVGPLPLDSPLSEGMDPRAAGLMAECSAHASALLTEGRLTWAFDPMELSVLARMANLRTPADLDAAIEADAQDELDGSGADIEDDARSACLRLCRTLTKESPNPSAACDLHALVDCASERRRRGNPKIAFGRIPDRVVLRETGDVGDALGRLFDARGFSQLERLDLLSRIFP